MAKSCALNGGARIVNKWFFKSIQKEEEVRVRQRTKWINVMEDLRKKGNNRWRQLTDDGMNGANCPGGNAPITELFLTGISKL